MTDRRSIIAVGAALATMAAEQAGFGEIVERFDIAEHVAVSINVMRDVESIGGTPAGFGKAHGTGNRYLPHQGKRECARRLRQLERTRKDG